MKADKLEDLKPLSNWKLNSKAKPLVEGERCRSVTADIHHAAVKAALGLEPIGEELVK